MPGHFPELTVYPGVFLLETVCQAVRVGLLTSYGESELSHVRSARLLKPLHAGTRVNVRAEVRLDASNVLQVSATCRDDADDKVAQFALACRRLSAPSDDVDDIASLLPHGHPMVLLDRIDALVCGTSIVASKAITRCEPCYAGLTRLVPRAAWAFPSSLLIESLGQAAAILWLKGLGARPVHELPMLTVIKNFQLESAAYPGDVLKHRVRIEQTTAAAAFASGETYVGDRRIAKCESIMAVVRSYR
jgi:3-hydroxyacyl-[acyl-carrier-protein] dehydratase